MYIRIVPLLAALLPFFAVHGTYLVAASHGLVDWCNPYIDSCTSISATGRKPPASYLFRATMLPSAVIMMAYWWLNHTWLNSLYNGGRRRTNHYMLGLGLLACTGLIMYVTVLGERGDAWAAQRRVGTVLFYSFTFLAQLLLDGFDHLLAGADLIDDLLLGAPGLKLLITSRVRLNLRAEWVRQTGWVQAPFARELRRRVHLEPLGEPPAWDGMSCPQSNAETVAQASQVASLAGW